MKSLIAIINDAEKILRENLNKLHTMAETLIKYETIGMDQIQDIMAGRDVREPAGYTDVKPTSTLPPANSDKEPQANGAANRNNNAGFQSAHDE